MSEPPPLDYRNPDDESPAVMLISQAGLGCLLSCGLVVGTVIAVLWMMAARSTEYDSVSWLMAWLVGGGVLAGLITLAIRAHRTTARRGWAIGIWLGLGIGCLIMGLCFMGFIGVAG
jgi:hypothetical protein